MAITTISDAVFAGIMVDLANFIETKSWDSAWNAYARAEAVHNALFLQNASQASSESRRTRLDGVKQALQMAELRANQLNGQHRIIFTKFDY